VVRPKDFVTGKKYPVILQVYGGPHAQQVHNARRSYLLAQWLADQGYLVVTADGRGTPRRGRAWERAIARDFATVIAQDQVAALRGLAARVPELDLARVGVIGWSFGGYLAGLLGMSRPDVFKSAVLGAPVVDWRDYDSCYTERYLGLPAEHPEAYQVSSLLTYVKDAQRPLLLLHGTADDNVYFLHTLKLSDALFRAGKPHAVLPLTNFTHLVADPVVRQRLEERVVRFFQETL
jgi:dipeptidyl-peptidase-4